jgi:hypothetical protein
MRTTDIQIHTFVGAADNLGASAVVLHKVGDGAPLTLVINARGKRMQTKKAFVAFTRNESCLPHTIRFCTIQVGPAFANGIIHELPGQINLKSLPTVFPQIILPLHWTSIILCTVNNCHIQLMHHSIKQPKEYAKVPPVGS